MIHVSRISYELGLFNANFDSRNKDLIPAPVLLKPLVESRRWILEEDPVFNERSRLGYFNARRSGFIRFRYSSINLKNIR